jgi:hypothetical protein
MVKQTKGAKRASKTAARGRQKKEKPGRVCFGFHLDPTEAKRLRAYVKPTGVGVSTWTKMLVLHHLNNPRPLGPEITPIPVPTPPEAAPPAPAAEIEVTT